MRLSDLSIKRPIFMSMVLLSILLFGFIALRTLGIDLYPRVEFPVATVVTILPGADPETIETMVTDPIEEAVSSLDSIKNLRSISSEGVSQIIIEFELEKDINIAYQEIQAKIGTLRNDLPPDIEGPTIEKFDVDGAPILTVIASSSRPLSELTLLVKKEVTEPLKRIPKIGQIKTAGGRDTKIWLWIDRDRLLAHHLTMEDVEQAIISSHIDLPGGRITNLGTELVVKTKGEFQTPQEFENLVISSKEGMSVRFRDIGRVEIGQEEERSAAHLNGKSAIALLIGRQSGSNSVEVAYKIKEEINRLSTKLEGLGIRLDLAQDNAIFIEHSVSEVRFHLLFGGGLAILIVLLFLRNLRSTLVCALALPTAVIGTFAFMSYMDFTQNMMTLLALSIAIGLLIDDAIVVQENIIRHIEEGESAEVAASKGTGEISLAVLSTTLSVVAVFIPVAFMKGIVGRFFYQFGMTVSFAVLISMFVAFTLNPLFSAKLLKVPKKGKVYLFLETIFEKLESAYAGILRFALRQKLLTLGLAATAFVGAMFVGGYLRFEFMPQQDQSEFSISVKAPQGSSLQYTRQLLTEIEKQLEGAPWLEYVFSTVGADALHSVHLGSIYVKMTEKETREVSQFDAMREMRTKLSAIEGGQITVEPFERMSGGGGKVSDIQFEVRGSSFDLLSSITDSIVKKLKDTKGYLDVTTSYEGGKPGVDITINRESAYDMGVSPLTIASAVSAAFGGKDVTTFKEKGERYDVAIRFDNAFRDVSEKLEHIHVRNATGHLIALHQLINVQRKEGPTQIDRYNRARQITVYANLDPNEKVLGEAITEINGFFASEALPVGYSYGFSGNAESFKESFGHLVFALFLAVILVYMVLAAQFESFIHPFTIMLTLPLSIVGAIGSLVLFNMTMSIFTMIGIIMLMGLVTKNGILLIDFIQMLVSKGDMPREEAIVLAGRRRLRPILMTTLAVVLGMLPIALGQGTGSETRAPMAVAVIGGLVTSTLLTLIVIPVTYQILENFRTLKWLKIGPRRRSKTVVAKNS